MDTTPSEAASYYTRELLPYEWHAILCDAVGEMSPISAAALPQTLTIPPSPSSRSSTPTTADEPTLSPSPSSQSPGTSRPLPPLRSNNKTALDCELVTKKVNSVYLFSAAVFPDFLLKMSIAELHEYMTAESIAFTPKQMAHLRRARRRLRARGYSAKHRIRCLGRAKESEDDDGACD